MMTTTRTLLLASLCGAIALAACSETRRTAGPGGPTGSSNGPSTSGNGDDGGVTPKPADMSMPQSPYPAGPYGNQIGDTLGDFLSSGYDGAGAWSTSIKLSDLRANPACKCILVTIGATWCSACQHEQPDLKADVASDPSFCVLGILQEGSSGSAATKSDLDAWRATYHQNFPVVLGTTKTDQLMSGYGPEVGLPFALIVKASSMEVLDNVQGYSSDLHAYATSLCGS